MSVKRRTNEPVSPPEATISETLSKVAKANAKWTDKDEFLDVVYWMRQIVGIIIGISWGIMPMRGILGILLFFALTTLMVYYYANNFQGIDEEEYGGITEVLKEGLMTSFATFVVSWIIVYSALHYD